VSTEEPRPAPRDASLAALGTNPLPTGTAAPQPYDEPNESWLLKLSVGFTGFWRYRLAIWGSPWLAKPGIPLTAPQVHRRIWLADLIWTLTLAGSIGFWVWAYVQLGNGKVADPGASTPAGAWGVSQTTVLLVLAMILWRLIDAFVNAADATPFGWGWVSQEKRSRPLHRRLVLLNVMTLLEVMFLNATLTYHLEWLGIARYAAPFDPEQGTRGDGLVRALQTSFSTLTTVGYGTCAPDNLLAVALAILETLTGLLLVSVVAASAISMALTPAPKAPPEDRPEEKPSKIPPLPWWQWVICQLSPTLGTVGMIAGLFWWLKSLVERD
jgi:hypothetical protein